MKHRTPESFIKKPIFPGGPKAMRDFIYRNLKYPTEMAQSGISGIVRVRYSIDKHGKVTETHVIKGIATAFDQEACRVLSLLHFEVPKNKGVRVLFHQVANIRFEVPRPPKPAQQPVQIVYHFQPNAKSDKT